MSALQAASSSLGIDNRGQSVNPKGTENADKYSLVQDLKTRRKNNLDNFKLSPFDPENMSSFMKFNTKPEAGYRLKHYFYLTDNVQGVDSPSFYLKYSPRAFNCPNLAFYPRFDEYKYSEDVEKEKETAFYSALFKEDNPITNKLVYNKQYRGAYSRQTDYSFFKIQMSNEIIRE